ncbi:MAG TPA: trigger factor [Nostocaceae cyanobacterium]|nr:trigger factor [Nostocaceae cyanobacterium]
MKITQEKLPASQIGLEIEIAPETTKAKYEQVIKNLTNTANIPGFRKGKVPRQILLQRLGTTRIKVAALEELIQEGIEQAIKQESIPAIGEPNLRSSFEDLINNYQPGQPLVFSAAVDVEPEVNLQKYTGLQAQAEEIKYDPSRVDSALEKEQQYLATLIPVEGRAAQLGDVVVVDYKGVTVQEGSESQPIPGGEGTDFQVELQEDKFIPGFVAGIVGMNPGETKEVSAQFPTPYTNEELSGKAAIFTITLKEIKEKELPELNDEFAQEVSEFETLAELKASLEERYQKEAADQTRSNKEEAIITELLKYTEIDLPATLIERELNAMLTQTAYRLSQQGIDVRQLFSADMVKKLQERSRPEAIDRLKRSLALREVGKKESITVPEQDIKARVDEILDQYEDNDLDEERLALVVEEELLTKKIFDWLLENSTVELVPEGSLTPPEEEKTETPVTESAAETATNPE